MTLALAFAIIVLVRIVFGIFNYRRPPGSPAGNWGWGGEAIDFLLIVILGWQVFGPLLHR